MKEFLIKHKLIIAFIISTTLLLLINSVNYNKLQEAKQEIERKDNNISALRDTIRIDKTKIGTLEYDKRSLITTNKELGTLSADLAKELEITKGQVITLQKTGFEVKHDTVEVPVIVKVKDSNTVNLTSIFDTTFSKGNFRNLAFEHEYNSKTGVATGKITKDEIGFTAVTGLKKTDLGYEIFVRPGYPNMQITSLEGAIIESKFFNISPKKVKKPLITLGATIGWTPITYDINTKQTDFKISRIGGTLGVQFNLFR